MNSYLWTHLKARLRLISSTAGANFNWLFLPGGPGLGSESLQTLTRILTLPGKTWHVDLPGDGSNHTSNDTESFSQWSQALVEVVDTLNNVILVAHSTGGMYVLATPKLEKKILGLILMDSAPNASWQNELVRYIQFHPTKETKKFQEQYFKKPSNLLLKKITLASAPYAFTKKGLQAGVLLLKKLPFNYKTYEWSAKYFDPKYKARWIPKNLPTLILAGEKDRITPLNFFL